MEDCIPASFWYPETKKDTHMGRTTPTLSVILQKEQAELSRFRRALRKEDQLVFDELWADASKHMMACTVADHLLPFEVFLLAMLLEERKEIMRLRRSVDELRRKR
jgi:hypothetical protein